MWAVVIALTLMMWMWSAASLHVSGWLAANANYPVRMAYLAVLTALGVSVLLSLLWLVLPGSGLSLGWSLKQLQNTQQLAAIVVVMAAIAGMARAHVLLKPARRPRVIPVATSKAVQKKRRT